MRKLLFLNSFSLVSLKVRRTVCALLSALLLSSVVEAQVQLGLGVQELIFSANATAAPQVGTTYSIPGAAVLLTWITSYASAPSSVTVVLELSNDNVVWAIADTSTSTAGESRSIFTAARFVRATESSRTGGGAITVSVIVKGGPVATVTANSQITAPVSVTSSSLATTSTDGILLANNTSATAAIPVQQSPRLRFFGNVWDTGTTTSKTDSWWLEAVGVSGNPASSILKFGNSNNGATATFPLTITTAGGTPFVTASYFVPVSGILIGGAGGPQIASLGTASTFNLLAGASGFGFDLATDAVAKFRVRAQNAYATVDALGYRVSGVSGASCVLTTITNLTVVNGIVTVCN